MFKNISFATVFATALKLADHAVFDSLKGRFVTSYMNVQSVFLVYGVN